MEETILEDMGIHVMIMLRRILGNTATAWGCGLDSSGWYFDKKKGCFIFHIVYKSLVRQNLREPAVGSSTILRVKDTIKPWSCFACHVLVGTVKEFRKHTRVLPPSTLYLRHFLKMRSFPSRFVWFCSIMGRNDWKGGGCIRRSSFGLSTHDLSQHVLLIAVT